ncbi:hypothetical protein ZOSMA_30G01120 [Zostera marina]|uniref:Inhibitor I9 domain-containing protein n=1 Tax=Zostera marina TaxID=29655 RepID=A0A0K9PC64_ZOSMR|nr:hypothetical protein ZOSMA_30G01120 [Zostera marina]
MESTAVVMAVAVCLLGFWANGFCGGEGKADMGVYIITMREASVVQYHDMVERFGTSTSTARNVSLYKGSFNTFTKPSNDADGNGTKTYTAYLIRRQNTLLRGVFKGESYRKLYSYHYLINGFAILVTHQQAARLAKRKEVANMAMDYSVRLATTHTPQFLGLPQGAWVQGGGPEHAGEGVVIGFPFWIL